MKTVEDLVKSSKSETLATQAMRGRAASPHSRLYRDRPPGGVTHNIGGTYNRLQEKMPLEILSLLYTVYV